MATVDEIKNLALQHLGFTEDVDFGVTTDKTVIQVNKQYETTKNYVMTTYPWNFALRTVELTGQVEETNKAFRYSYDIPANFIVLRAVFTDQYRRSPIREYELYDGKLYCDYAEVHMYYVIDFAETSYPEFFINFFTIKLAYDLCMPVTGDTDLKQILFSEQQQYFKEAKKSDKRNVQTLVIKNSPYTGIRL